MCPHSEKKPKREINHRHIRFTLVSCGFNQNKKKPPKIFNNYPKKFNPILLQDITKKSLNEKLQPIK